MGYFLPVITEPRERQDNARKLLCSCPECLSKTGESRATTMETKPLPKLRKTLPESGEGRERSSVQVGNHIRGHWRMGLGWGGGQAGLAPGSGWL